MRRYIERTKMDKNDRFYLDMAEAFELAVQAYESNSLPIDFFIESSYLDNKGQSRPNFLITKKGCDMIANKTTGKKGVLFTAAREAVVIAGGYDGSIRINTRLDHKGFTKGIDSIGNSLKKLAGLVGAAFGVAAIVNFSKESIKAASALSGAWLQHRAPLCCLGNP